MNTNFFLGKMSWSRSLLAVAVFFTLSLTLSDDARACNACVNKSCAAGLAQGTYGCTEVGMECSWLSRIMGTCVVYGCSTAGNPPCDNNKIEIEKEEEEGESVSNTTFSDDSGFGDGAACSTGDDTLGTSSSTGGSRF